MTLGATPSQTLGPFFADALVDPGLARATACPGVEAEPMHLEGRIVDAGGSGVDDALVELWRADPDHDDVAGDGHGWARSATDAEGRYRFWLPRPRPLPHPSAREQAPHVVLLVLARGILDVLLTRAYPVEEPTVPDDPVLRRVPAERRGTLLAVRDGEVDGVPRYRFDVRLQGPGETVFFQP